MERNPQIDGLRAIAIILVISFHYINNQLVGVPHPFAKFLYFSTSFGWAGVDLFFVLSGFLIGSILIKNQEKGDFFKTFYLRRFVRIIPNYFLLIFFFLIIINLPLLKDDYFLSGNRVIPIWSYFLMVHNLFMASLHNMGNTAMSVTWSIGIEEQFYLLFPLFIYFIKPKFIPAFLVFVVLLANLFRLITPILPGENFSIPAYVLLPCRMDAISFGILIAWMNLKLDFKILNNNHLNSLYFLIFLIVSICGYLMVKFGDIGPIRNSLFALVFSSILVISLARPNSYFGQILGSKILVWIGRISYSLYLFHYIILGVFVVIGQNYFPDLFGLKGFIISIIAISFSVLFSWLIFKYFETPFVKFGKKFVYK